MDQLGVMLLLHGTLTVGKGTVNYDLRLIRKE